MSPSLSIQIDPVDRPATTDPVEQATWCRLSVQIGGQTITRIWDKKLQQERSELFVPAFPIAEWIIDNWWALLNEPCRGDRVPDRASARLYLPWVQRHCLRAADSCLLLPALYLYNNGYEVIATWQADDPGSLPHMTGEFLAEGSANLSQQEVMDAFASVLTEVFARTSAVDDKRVNDLREHWQTIQSTDSDVRDFCVVAGRMGLNPYDPAEVSDELAEFIETSLGRPDIPLNRDLTEVANASSVMDQWSWVQRTSEALRLHQMPQALSRSVPPSNKSGKPYNYGYAVARTFRSLAHLGEAEPVESIEDIGRRLTGMPIRMEARNHLPGQGIRGVVGWSNDSAIVAAPAASNIKSRQFILARGLFNALLLCDESQRLMTDANTWDQQASRAFAAEFLAPQDALSTETGARADRSKVSNLADRFNVSTWVIERQLDNANVAISDE